MKPFQKPPLTVAEQINLLKKRNLSILDEERATRFLEVVSLFRLSPYMRPFQLSGNPEHRFISGTTLRQIVTIYKFDGQLRSLVMEAIERVEVAVRAGISNHMAPKYGSAWYSHSGNFKRDYDHQRLLDGLTTKIEQEKRHYQREIKYIEARHANSEVKQKRIEQRKRDNYFRYYGVTYHSPDLPPSWAMLEELSLGTLSRLYQNIARDADKKRISARFELPHEVLGSWLHTLTFIRNICAHHSRLWNRELSIKPKLPKSEEWQLPSSASQAQPEKRLYIVLLMLAAMTGQIAPDSHWKQRLIDLLSQFPDTPLSAMGFPSQWQQHPIWQALP